MQIDITPNHNPILVKVSWPVINPKNIAIAVTANEIAHMKYPVLACFSRAFILVILAISNTTHARTLYKPFGSGDYKSRVETQGFFWEEFLGSSLFLKGCIWRPVRE